MGPYLEGVRFNWATIRESGVELWPYLEGVRFKGGRTPATHWIGHRNIELLPSTPYSVTLLTELSLHEINDLSNKLR
jgi:hypothetical protein